jgi:hypothetical protein
VNKRMRFFHKVKAPQLLVGLLLGLGFLTGCTSAMPQQNPYMMTGAGLGAALGAGLGAAASPANRWAGAAIGGLLGTAVGGVAGEAYGRSVNPPPYYQPPAYSAPVPGYSYRTPPASDSYAYETPPPAAAPSSQVRTPVTPAPYYSE